MPISFTCPHCGSQTLVDDAFAGRTGDCFVCGKPISVPATASSSAAQTPSEPRVSPTASTKNLITITALIVAGLVVGAGMLSLLVWLAIPALNTSRQATHQQHCSAKLQQIAAAMKKYHDEHGNYPPAYVTDANGKPMHSWRVLLLPYLGHQSLFNQYNMNLPWDSPQNSLLKRQIPDIYSCPADPGAKANGETSFLVIVGPATMFPGSKSTNRLDLVDGHGTTIMLVETTNSPVAWLEPKDLEAADLTYELNGTGTVGIRSQHPHGVHVLMADGSVYFLADTTSPEYVQALTTIQGQEPVPLQQLIYRKE